MQYERPNLLENMARFDSDKTKRMEDWLRRLPVIAVEETESEYIEVEDKELTGGTTENTCFQMINSRDYDNSVVLIMDDYDKFYKWSLNLLSSPSR
ncbi:hypothetical protein QVD17_29762 [Tagetes erecta]|uniref:Uncharacterized protein n=1 Tax=Tagetes erecta TaxID=13708 RepID=A0AAD8K6K6_TARER|nr:hypothetical protein QVD17_29762 [Tagetes erecta]